MLHSKLIELLKKYPIRRTNKFAEYVHSPYFNKRPVLAKLCDYLLRQAPHFSDKYLLEKDTIFYYLYPEKKENAAAPDSKDIATLHRLFSDLLQLFYDFLALQHWQQRHTERDLWVLRELRKTKMDGHYSNLSKEISEDISGKKELLQSERFYYQFKLHKELNDQFIDQGGRHYDAHLQQLNDNLDAFFICEKLKIACDMASRNVVIKADYQCSMLQSLLEHLPKTPLAQNAYINVYQHILQLRTAQDPAEEEPLYARLAELLQENAPLFTPIEQTDMYGYALNYAIQQINKGKQQYYRDAFEHYRYMVENRLIFVDDYLPAWDYKNIVTIALRLEEFAWTEQFIGEYRRHLPPDIQENAYRYNLASHYYAVGKYGDALQALHNVDFTDATYQLGAKIIQLKSYYELNEGEALQSLVNAFGALLRRHKNLSDYWKDSNLNCVKLAQRIYNLKEKKLHTNPKKWEEEFFKIKAEVEQTTPLANKPWLEQCLSGVAG